MTAGLPERLLKKCFWAIPFFIWAKINQRRWKYGKVWVSTHPAPRAFTARNRAEMTLPVLVLEGKIRNWI